MAFARYGAQADVMVGTIFIGYKGFGWSEKYYLNMPNGADHIVPTYREAGDTLLSLTTHRARLLGLGANIIWARASLLSKKRESYPGINAPVAPIKVHEETTVEVINTVDANYKFRIDDGEGSYHLRAFRGLRDSWVTDQDKIAGIWADSPLETATPAAAETGGLFTPVNALWNFIIFLQRNTVGLKKGKNAEQQYVTYPLQNWSFRGVGNRDTGRPFGQSRGRALSRV